jgi:hypothetical protein
MRWLGLAKRHFVWEESAHKPLTAKFGLHWKAKPAQKVV